MPLRFSLHWDGATPYTVLVSIYAEDGTVAVSHGGVEIGQGINTKVSLSLSLRHFSFPSSLSPLSLSLSLSHSHSHSLSLPPSLSPSLPPFHSFSYLLQVAQVAAKTLGIPLEMVRVKSSMTLTNPNGQTTGGSTTSELNCLVSPLRHYVMIMSFKLMCVCMLVGYNSGLSGVEPANPTNP